MIFKTDKLPFLLTILFGLSAWSLTRIVDNFVSSPILEYKIAYNRSSLDSGYIYYSINNIGSHVLKNVQFRLSYFSPQDGRVLSGEIITKAPATKININTTLDEANNEFIEYEIPQIQPGWEYILSAGIKGPKHPILSFYSKDNETINLKEVSVTTFLIKHQNSIIYYLLLVWIICILGYFIFLSRENSKQEKIEGYESQI